jgi:putative NADH-flavin reductase
MVSSKVLILGATGGTGRLVVSQALRAGHEVSVLVRDPTRLTTATDRLRVTVGSLTDSGDALENAMRDQDVVVSTVGRGPSLKSEGLIATSARAIVDAMNAHGIRRLIFMSAFGVGVTRRDTPLVPRIAIRLPLRDIYADKEVGDKIVLGSDLDWTIAYPTALTNGPATGVYRVGERVALRGFPKVSRADVADFIVSQIVDDKYLRKQVLISS